MTYSPSDHTFAVCAYGESSYLEACIRSLKEQSVPSTIILCTGTPNEHIRNMAEKYDLPLHISTDKQGIAEDWNYALCQANTKLVTLAHQDDIYEPEYTETVLDAVSSCEDTLICFTDSFEIRGEKRVYADQFLNLRIKKMLLTPLKVKKFQNNRWIRRRVLSLGNPVCCPSVTYAAQKMPDPLFQTHFKSNVDWQTWERLSRKEGRFLYIPRPLVGHRIHEGSTTAEVVGNGSGRRKEDLEMLCTFWPKPIAQMIESVYSLSQKQK